MLNIAITRNRTLYLIYFAVVGFIPLKAIINAFMNIAGRTCKTQVLYYPQTLMRELSVRICNKKKSLTLDARHLQILLPTLKRGYILYIHSYMP